MSELVKGVTPKSGEDFATLSVSRQASSLYLPYRIEEPQADFYPQTVRGLLACCGYEYGTKEFHSAINFLNHQLSLGLDELDLRVMGYLLTGLSQAKRFGRDVHISEEQGENSATHSCHTTILNTELMRRAGLLTSEAQTPEVIELRIESTLADLIHDIGESLGEFSSLADRSLDTSRVEIPEVERRVFAICLRLAYTAALEGPAGGAKYYQNLWDFRLLARAGKLSNPMTTSLALKAIENFESSDRLKVLDIGTEGRIARYLKLFDMCELRQGKEPLSKQQIFGGVYAKLCERLQGTRHIIRFGEKDPDDRAAFIKLMNPSSLPSTSGIENDESAIPLRYVSNNRVRKNATYMEEDLYQLFQNAQTDVERTLAGAVRDAIYLTMAEWFSVSRAVVNRSVTSEDPYLVDLQKELAQLPAMSERAFFQRHTIRNYLEHLLAADSMILQEMKAADDNQEPSQKLRVFESRERLRAVYLQAVSKQYVPKNEVPLALGELPSELHGFTECMSSIERFAYKDSNTHDS
jgi:hypothetical protein